MNHITDILYWISTGLLVPVVVLLILLFLRSLLLLGSFFGEYVRSLRNAKSTEDILDSSDLDMLKELPQEINPRLRKTILSLLSHRGNHPAISKIVSDFEIEVDRELGVSKMLSKMGPMLGLMGTLIPMGPALVGLSTGDIASMAYNMQVAFATTVIGLFAAAIGYVTLQIRSRWRMSELNRVEYIAALCEKGDKE